MDWFKIVIALIIVFFLLWIYQQLGFEKLDHVFLDTYDHMLNSGRVMYDNYFTDPHELYVRTVGYEYDDNAEMAINKALKRERMYAAQELEGKSAGAEAVTNAFILGDLHQYNSKNRDVMVSTLFYNRALDRLSRFKDKEPLRFTVDFMVDKIENFYDVHPEVQRAVIKPKFERIRADVRERAVTSETTDKYFQRRVNSDPQNVHDSHVNSDTRQLYDRIVAKNRVEFTQVDHDANIGEIRAMIDKNGVLSADDKERVQNIIDLMNKNNTTSNIEAGEREIISSLWQRIKSAENTERRPELEASLTDALLNCSERDSRGRATNICLTGRSNQVLSSLTLLDSSDELSKPIKTKDILRQEIFAHTHQAIQDALSKQPEKVQDAYNGKTEETAESLKFTKELRGKIEADLKRDYDNPQLIQDALAGI